MQEIELMGVSRRALSRSANPARVSQSFVMYKHPSSFHFVWQSLPSFQEVQGTLCLLD
jgi:hypothetical protein